MATNDRQASSKAPNKASNKASKNAKASAKVRAAQQQKRQRMQWSIGIVVLVVVGIVVLVLAKTSTNTSSDGEQYTAQSAPDSIATDLASVPLPAIAAAAKANTSSNPVQPVPDGKPRTKDGKPEVLYMGGEFCPFCAGERWAMTVALSKFGEFSDLKTITSRESDVPTLSFVGSTFDSKYVTFNPVEVNGNEREGRGWSSLETPTEEQSQLLKGLGGGAFPFIDFGGTSFQKGGSVAIEPLLGKEQTDIASTLAASTVKDTDISTVPGDVNSVAGEFIRTICGLTDNQPAKVCKAFPEA